MRKNGACAGDGRARAARRTSCLSRLSGVSHVCRRQESRFDFHGTSSSPEKASSKGTRDTCRREKSRRGHGAAADDAARCVGGLTAIRSASTKATACPAALQYFNHEFWELTDPRRTRRTKRWRPAARTKVGEAASRPWLLARTSRGLTIIGRSSRCVRS